jgi:hypothetical protein
MRSVFGLFLVAVVSLVSAGTACRQAPSQAGVTWPTQVVAATLETAAMSMGPQLTSSARGTILSWLELQDTTAILRYSERGTGGSWSAPRTITRGTDWFVSEVDMPAVLRMRNGSLVAQWLKAVDLALEAYDVRLAFSRDDGQSWSEPLAPHHDGTTAQHGFVSLFEWPEAAGGGLGLVWLDGRKMAAEGVDPPSDEMSLYRARFDTGGKQVEEAALDGRVCECCATGVAVASAGPVVAFRDRSSKEVRDIYVARATGTTWEAPTTVHADNWTIDACPVNGPAVAASGSAVAVAWFSQPGEDGHAFVAFSSDGGRTFGAPVRVDDVASLGHVGVTLLDDGAAVVSWVEFDGGASFRARRVDGAGMRGAPLRIAGGKGRFVSGIPRVIRQGDAIVFAWTESGGEDPGASQRVKVATAPLPTP